jgi:predicted nuclease of predicted toxin-antitoxin system
MNIVIDMNLSPLLGPILSDEGWKASHWSSIGAPNAPDHDIMAWARSNTHVVLTHDLDFGVLLALTHAQGPSVIQVRTQNVLPSHLSPIIIPVLRKCEVLLREGVLITVDEIRSRVRILPL